MRGCSKGLLKGSEKALKTAWEGFQHVFFRGDCSFKACLRGTSYEHSSCQVVLIRIALHHLQHMQGHSGLTIPTPTACQITHTPYSSLLFLTLLHFQGMSAANPSLYSYLRLHCNFNFEGMSAANPSLYSYVTLLLAWIASPFVRDVCSESLTSLLS